MLVLMPEKRTRDIPVKHGFAALDGKSPSKGEGNEKGCCTDTGNGKLHTRVGHQLGCGEPRHFDGHCNGCWRIERKSHAVLVQARVLTPNPAQRQIREWTGKHGQERREKQSRNRRLQGTCKCQNSKANNREGDRTGDVRQRKLEEVGFKHPRVGCS